MIIKTFCLENHIKIFEFSKIIFSISIVPKVIVNDGIKEDSNNFVEFTIHLFEKISIFVAPFVNNKFKNDSWFKI